MRKNYLALTLILFFSINGFASNTIINDSLKLAYNKILSLNFKQADQILIKERKASYNGAWVDYLYNYQDFLTVFIQEDKSKFDELEPMISKRYKAIEKLPDTSQYKNWMLANINLQWAIVRLKFQQYLAAAWDINKAYRLIVENKTTFPDFVPNDITLGILHVMIGLVPDKYRWMLKIVSMNGTVKQGKKELYSVLDSTITNEKYNYLKDETLFYLGFMELNLAPDRKGLNKLNLFLDSIPESQNLIAYLKIDILIRTGKNNDALALLNKITNQKNIFPFYYLYYLKGNVLLDNLNPNALKNYRYFLTHFKGINYIKDAWRKMGWAYLIDGDTVNYHIMMDSVVNNGYALVGADKNAEMEAQKATVPNVFLLKSRLLFDGGYYNKSLNILDSLVINFHNPNDKLEKIYRYARIYHETGEIYKAKKAYRQTLKVGRYASSYFAANAALKLGEIYESEDSLKIARYYYKQCLSLPFKVYRNSIRGKAKEALYRLN